MGVLKKLLVSTTVLMIAGFIVGLILKKGNIGEVMADYPIYVGLTALLALVGSFTGSLTSTAGAMRATIVASSVSKYVQGNQRMTSEELLSGWVLIAVAGLLAFAGSYLIKYLYASLL